MTSLRKKYSDALGLYPWQQRNKPLPVCSACDAPETVTHTKKIKLLVIHAEKSFTSSAQQLFNAMLKATNIQRDEIFIIHLQTASSCLQSHMIQLNPQVILAAGDAAANHLRALEKNSIPVVVTHDPAYLIKNLDAKKKTFMDLQSIHPYLL